MPLFYLFHVPYLFYVSCQETHNNLASLQGLVAAITELLTMLNDQIRSYGEEASRDSKFMQSFDKFSLCELLPPIRSSLISLTKCLLKMKDDLDEILKKSHKSFGKRMLHRDQLSRLNANYVRHMDDLRLNFLVSG